MKALQLLQGQARLELRDVPYPSISQPTDVLVRVAYAGVCGTDLHALQNEHPMSHSWTTLGHEFSGVVEAVGAAVTTCRPGDRVAVDPNIGCGRCRSCKEGRVHFCSDGVGAIGYWRHGGWAEATVAPEASVHRLPDGLPLSAACLCEPLSCLLHGLDRATPVAQHGRTLVLGAGIIGLLTACVLHHQGLRHVTVSEPTAARRAFVAGLQLGYEAVTPQQAAAQFDGSESRGLDLAFDCSGSCAAVERAVPWLRRGGALCLFGLPPPAGRVSVSPHLLVSRELAIIGTIINPLTFGRAVQLAADMADRYLQLPQLGCQLFSLEQHHTAIDQLKAGEISKAVFVLDSSL